MRRKCGVFSFGKERMDMRLRSAGLWLLLAVLIFPLWTFTVRGADIGASLSGPETFHPGDTVTLVLKLDGDCIFSASGCLDYDHDRLELISIAPRAPAVWRLEFNGDCFTASDPTFSAPITAPAELFSVTFQIRCGTEAEVTCRALTVSDGSLETAVTPPVWRAAAETPPSADSSLTLLSVENAELAPSFTPDTTAYTAQVPFDVERLEIRAVPADTSAQVSISNPALIPDGDTDVTVTVTAENGAIRIYTIRVHREKDPAYVPRGESALSVLSVEGFDLSPAFSPEVLEYTVWLPFEADRIRVSAAAADALAAVSVKGGEDLKPGADNTVKVICTAGDGSVTTYTITVKRAAQNTNPSGPAPAVPAPTAGASVPSEPVNTKPLLPKPAEPSAPPTAGAPAPGIPAGAAALLFMLFLLAGLALGWLIKARADDRRRTK